LFYLLSLLSLTELNKSANLDLKITLLMNWFLKSLTLNTMSMMNKTLTELYGNNKIKNVLTNSLSELLKLLTETLLPPMPKMLHKDVLLLLLPLMLIWPKLTDMFLQLTKSSQV